MQPVTLIIFVLSLLFSAGVMAIAYLVLGYDPAYTLARCLHLGGGLVLAGLLGSLLGAWLAWGGLPRQIDFAGWLIGRGFDTQLVDQSETPSPAMW